MKQLLPLQFAFDFSFPELNESISVHGASAQFKAPTKGNIHHDIYEIFASSPGSLVYTQYPKMIPDHISTIRRRPFGRIDDVALRRWAFFTVE
jgi:hypothetical protein